MKIMKPKYISVLFALFLAIAVQLPSFAATAPQVLKTASDKVLKAKGISCTFTLAADGRKVNGSLKAVGKKFAISTPLGSSWYNGKDLATYNPSSKETTIVEPTASELAETNPLLYLGSYTKDYSAAFTKNMPKGKFVVVLTPKNKRAAIRKVVVTLNSRTYAPEKIEVTGSDNRATVVTVSAISYNASLGGSVFEYPKSKYPHAEIVDLR